MPEPAPSQAAGERAAEIAILLATFNGERYLAAQLDSILTQSHGAFELLIVDDGSSDASAAIASEYARRDDRVRIVASVGNRGQKSRLFELFTASRAPLIAIADQDDIWDGEKLARLKSGLGEAGLAFGRSELIDGKGASLGRTLLEVNRSVRRPGDRLTLFFRPQVSGHALLARREIFCEAAFRSAEPYDWLLGLNAEFSRGVVYRDDAIVRHRVHAANSYNDTIAARANPLRLRPQHLAKALRRIHGRRARFVAGLAFLAGSPQVDEPTREAFQTLATACDQAWIRAAGTPSLPPRTLRRLILATLEPFAGSSRDWTTAVDNVSALTLGMLSPTVLARLPRLL